MKKKNADQIFNEFSHLVEKTFIFLEQNGFKIKKRKPSGHEIGVGYLRPDIRVEVNYEIGSGPWVTLAKEKNGKWEDAFLKERFDKTESEFLLSNSPGFSVYAKPRLKKELDIWAKALRQSLVGE